MKLRTIENGNFDILLKAQMKAPYPKLKANVFLEKDKANVVAVVSQLTCAKMGEFIKDTLPT